MIISFYGWKIGNIIITTQKRADKLRVIMNLEDVRIINEKRRQYLENKYGN